MMTYDGRSATLVVSQPSASPLFPGFGIKKVRYNAICIDGISGLLIMILSEICRLDRKHWIDDVDSYTFFDGEKKWRMVCDDIR